MKPNKALKRIAKIEGLLANVIKGSAVAAPHLQGALVAVGRAKEAVSAKPPKATKPKPEGAVKKAKKVSGKKAVAKKAAPSRKAMRKAAKKKAAAPVQSAEGASSGVVAA